MWMIVLKLCLNVCFQIHHTPNLLFTSAICSVELSDLQSNILLWTQLACSITILIM